MRKRNRIIAFLVIPLVVFFWVFGWSLYQIGSNKTLLRPVKGDGVNHLTFTVLMPEQEYAE